MGKIKKAMILSLLSKITNEEKLEMFYKTNTTKDVLINYIINILTNVNTKDFGRIMGSLIDKDFSKNLIESNTNISIIDAKNDVERDGNESSYDLLTKAYNRIQIKFRQYQGKDAYSRSTYLSTTRRHSSKNGKASTKTGCVDYASTEFDGVLIALCPHKNKFPNKQYIENWSYSFISSKKLINPENPNYLLSYIPSKFLKEGSNWQKELEKLENG